MPCDFGLVDNIVNQIADIARSAMEARNFFLMSGMFVIINKNLNLRNWKPVISSRQPYTELS